MRVPRAREGPWTGSLIMGGKEVRDEDAQWVTAEMLRSSKGSGRVTGKASERQRSR